MNEVLDRLELKDRAIPGELAGIAICAALDAIIDRIEALERLALPVK